MMNTIAEHTLIDLLAGRFRRSPGQVNRLHEADAELVRIGPETYLAATTDALAEEISQGLYRDPYLIGWMAVMANMSDLAAVGARPLGIVISELLPAGTPEAYLLRLQKGIEEACTACETYVLGGDTNTSAQLVLTGCAFGIVKGSAMPVGRVGCSPGDILYSTGPLGSGNAYALAQFDPREREECEYRPVARLNEGEMISAFATARMDTSDGAMATLDELARLNGAGFALDEAWEHCCCQESLAIAASRGIPEWLLLAGQHGEFELLFTIPRGRETAFRKAAARHGFVPLRLGRVVEEPGVTIPLYGTRVKPDTARIRNLAFRFAGDIETYICHLLRLDEEIKKGVYAHESA